jgi:carbonic anhydrase
MFALAFVAAACGGDSGDDGGKPLPKAHAAHFGYQGEAGPEHWGDISEEWEACEVGKAQSPVDLSASKAADLPGLAFDYRPTPVAIVNNGHTVQVNYEKGSTLTVGGAVYELVQFHFHAPSEHTVDGKHHPLEMHLVHKDAAGKLAVVGVLVEEGEANPAFAPVFDHLPKMKAPLAVVPEARVNAEELLPADLAYYAYAGSLTTPPCSEGVHWKVLAKPVQMSKEQIEAFRRIYPGNNRPVQGLNGRVVERN